MLLKMSRTNYRSYYLDEYPVRNVLSLLLKDKTTKQSIIFATNAYRENDDSLDERAQITESILRYWPSSNRNCQGTYRTIRKIKNGL